MSQKMQNEGGVLLEPEYEGWLADDMDHWYPELLEADKGPYRPVRLLMDIFPEISQSDPSQIAILDAACGTGNNYFAFTARGYNIWATDGAERMLEHAASNCRERGVSDAQLVRERILWTDTRAYTRHFIDKGIAFDLILLTSNSLCHIPMVPGYMDVALSNFRALLKPNGRLLIDTKRYAPAGYSNDVQMFYELRHDKGEWVRRIERDDPARLIEGRGLVSFHTRLDYDIDPDFNVCRARLHVTLNTEGASSESRVLSYYPLPADSLIGWLAAAGFETDVHPAKTKPLEWSYDFLVSRRKAQP